MKQIFEVAKKTFLNNSREKFPGTITSYDDFTSLSELRVRLERGKLLFVIFVPFTNSQNYTVYHVLPHIVNLTHGYGYTKPLSNYYLINDNARQYITLKYNQLENCKIIQSTYVCFDTYIINKYQPSAPCEIKIIFSINIPNIETCDIRITKQKKNRWMKSLDNYKIYYSLIDPEDVKISCKNDATTIKLNEFGVITLTGSCQIESKDFKYLTPKTRTFISSAISSPTLNMNILKILLNLVKFGPRTDLTNEKEDFQFLGDFDSEVGAI